MEFFRARCAVAVSGRPWRAVTRTVRHVQRRTVAAKRSPRRALRKILLSQPAGRGHSRVLFQERMKEWG